MSLPFLPADPSGIQVTLWLCAFGGSLFFLTRVMLILVGGFADDFDSSIDDAQIDDSSVDAHHSEAAFKLISLNTISAFIMMFGWAGLCAHLQYGLHSFLSAVIAFVVGLFAMYVTAWMYRAAMRLASKGADFAISEVIGLHGSVYQKIPAEGVGKIQVAVNGLVRELEARSSANEELPSFTRVLVTGTIDNATVTVEKSTEPTTQS